MDNNMQDILDNIDKKKEAKRREIMGDVEEEKKNYNEIKPDFFTVHRNIFESSLWNNPQLFRLYFWLIGRANFKDNPIIIGGKRQTIKRGQLMTSYANIGKALNSGVRKGQCLSYAAIRRRIATLEMTGKIIKESNNEFTLITVLNYDYWQKGGQGQKGESEPLKRTTTEQRPNTINNVNNDNKKKKKKKKKIFKNENLESHIKEKMESKNKIEKVASLFLVASGIRGDYFEFGNALKAELHNNYSAIKRVKNSPTSDIVLRLEELASSGLLSWDRLEDRLKSKAPNISEILGR